MEIIKEFASPYELDECMVNMETFLEYTITFINSPYTSDFIKEIYKPLNFLTTDPHAIDWLGNAFTTLEKVFYRDKTLWVIGAYDLTTQLLLVKYYRTLRNKKAKKKESTEINFVELCNTYLNTLSSTAKEYFVCHLAKNKLWMADYDTAKLILLNMDELT